MITLTSKKIADILGVSGKYDDTLINQVSTDSRKIDQSTLFLALKGEKFDGHNFIKQVLENGCPLVVSEKAIEGVDSSKIIIVEDTLKALGKLAQYNRQQFKGTVIALTGSSGKTTTKEELKLVLGKYAKTYATSGNFNNHIGVPRSLLDIDMDARYAIIEMGMSALGEISYLTHLVQPDIAIVTNVYPMHIEFLKTIENIATAKAEIFQGLKDNGVALYNEDASCVEILKSEAEKYSKHVYTYGKNSFSDIQLNMECEEEYYYANAHCVLKVVELLGLDLDKAVEGINSFSAPEGRGKKYYLDINGKRITLVDDSYSGQPEAMKLAIRKLAKEKGRKVVVIGKMAELGHYSKQAHIEVGQELAKNHIDAVIGVCEETKDVLEQLPPEVLQTYFPDVRGVVPFLLNDLLEDGDILLIKGAHYSSKVYKIVEVLKFYSLM